MRKTSVRHRRPREGHAAHVKAMLNPEDDDTVLDDPSIDEDDEGDADKAFLVELQAMAEQAREFARS
jgi:hypothetical protein